MNVAEMKSCPVWLDHARPQFAPLTRDAHFDVIVIGGGITGLTAAYLLKQAGKKVGVFEKGQVGDAETGHTTAHLVYITDLRLRDLMKQFGRDEALLAWNGGDAAISLIEQIVKQEQISCGFQHVPGFLHSPLEEDDHDVDMLKDEADKGRELGFDAKFLSSIPFGGVPGVRYPNQAIFHPIEYLAALAKTIHGDGSEVFCESEMTEAEDDPLSVTVNGHKVTGDRLIIATHIPLVGISGIISAALLQSKLANYSTYAIGARIPSGVVPPGSYNDTSDPYYYLRVHSADGHDYAILGGEDHKTGQVDDEEARYAHLAELLEKWFPGAVIDHRWSGQVVETNDGLPFIGPTNDRQFVATGFAGNGMTFGTLSGMMACDWVSGRENPWADLFSVDRKKIRGGTWHYLIENADYPYHLVKGFLKRTAGDFVDDVPLGEGRVIKINGSRRAVYRSPDGTVKNCSAICTHLGCVVRWNGAEDTWDCPCHGSRFNTDGEVLAGPAETPLSTDDE